MPPRERHVARTQPMTTMRTIAVLNHKGGVGKTTVTLNLAGALAEMGYRTLVVDCDSQGDLSSLLIDSHDVLPYSVADLFAGSGVTTQDVIQPTGFANISVLTADRRLNVVERTYGFEEDPASMALANALSEVQKHFDFALLDCATKPHLTGYAALCAAHEAIVPCEPSQFSLRSLATIIEQVQAVRRTFNPGLGVRYFLSKTPARSKTADSCRKVLADTFGAAAVFTVSIPNAKTVDTAVNLRKPVVVHSKKSKVAEGIREFALEFLGAHYGHQHGSHKVAA